MRFKILTIGDEDLLLEFLLWLTPEALELWSHHGKKFDKKRIQKILKNSNEFKIAGIDIVSPDISQSYSLPERRERIVVFGHLYKFTKNSCRLGIISGITGKGYGTRMMNKLIHFAKETGVKKIYLSTFQDNYPALSLYKKFNFKIIKEYSDRLRKAYELELELQ